MIGKSVGRHGWVDSGITAIGKSASEPDRPLSAQCGVGNHFLPACRQRVVPSGRHNQAHVANLGLERVQRT
jgi:hypothetical protein